MLRLLVALLLIPLASPLLAEDAQMPATLVIGYDEEGKVDASEAGCRAFVQEVVEWEKAQVDQAVHDVCAVRKRHADAYVALQQAYAAFRAALAENTRFDGVASATHLSQMVKSCIEHKWAITTGGHNIGIDMVPNAIDADCLEIGRALIVKETAYLKGE